MKFLKDRLSILVTGAGAPGIRGTIYALRTNSDGIKVRIIGVDGNADVVGQFLLDRFYKVPFPEEAEYIETLASICEKEDVDIVIPQTTREVAVLSQHSKHLDQLGVRTMVSDCRAVQLANDKWSLIQTFNSLRLPIPECKLARNESDLIEFADQLGYPRAPVVVKPPVSNGMRGVRVLREDAWDVTRFLNEKPGGLEISLDELIRILRRGPGWPDLLVMQHLPGPEYSVDVYIGEKMEVAIPRLRKAIRSGITFESVCEAREDLCHYSIMAAKHIGLRYAFGFQYKLDSLGVPRILECNPRVQGTMVASSFAGPNVIWLAIKELAGEPPCDSPSPLKEALFYRFWGGVGVYENQIYEI